LDISGGFTPSLLRWSGTGTGRGGSCQAREPDSTRDVREKASFRDGRVGRGGRRGSRRTWRRASRYATASESKGSRGLARARPSGVVARRDVSARSIGAEGRSRSSFRHATKSSTKSYRTDKKISGVWDSAIDDSRSRKTSPSRASLVGRISFRLKRLTCLSYENTWFVTQRLIPNDFGMSNKNAGRYALGRICAFWRKQKKTTVSSDLSRPREVVASIASCARQVSGYRARVPPRYVPAAFPPSRGRSDDRSSTTADPPSRRVSVAEDAFSFFLPRGVRQYRFVCISRARRVRAARAASGAACASRARLATRLLRPRQSDPLPRHSPPRLRPPRFAPRKRAGESWYERTTLSPTQRSHG
jgi:hypothetical protein